MSTAGNNKRRLACSGPRKILVLVFLFRLHFFFLINRFSYGSHAHAGAVSSILPREGLPSILFVVYLQLLAVG